MNPQRDTAVIEAAEPGTAEAAAQAQHRLAIARNLISTMMLGQVYGLRDDAQAIYRAATAMMGNGRSLSVSLALASALGGDTQPARDLLAGDLPNWPDAEPAMVSIALALKIGGAPEWSSLVEHALSVSVDEETRRFAQQVQRASV
jgi:hypothetical protein